MKVKTFPAALILTLLWAVMKFMEIDTSVSDMPGIVLLIVTFLVAMFEFYKSVDVNQRQFLADVCYSVAQAFLCGILIRSYYEYITLPDLVLVGANLVDATLSPWNSYRSGTRDLLAGGDGDDDHHHRPH